MQPNRPRVVVLIPFYGQPETLAVTLLSLAQDGFFHDVIVVDDGNTPPWTTCGKWHPRVTVIRNQRNSGITAALNIGLNRAIESGYEFIARIDAGDRVIAGRFGQQVSFLDRAPACKMVGTQARFMDSDGRLLFTSKLPASPADITRQMHRRTCFIHPTVMFRACVFKEIGYYREKYPAAEDYDLFFRIAERFPTANLPEAFIDYEVSSGSISSRRRNLQLLSKLRITLAHFNGLLLASYLGVMEAGLGLLLPRWATTRLRIIQFRFETAFRKLGRKGRSVCVSFM